VQLAVLVADSGQGECRNKFVHVLFLRYAGDHRGDAGTVINKHLCRHSFVMRVAPGGGAVVFS
jgi:hypothetical protein